MECRESLLIRTGRDDRDVRRDPGVIRAVRGVHVDRTVWLASDDRERILLRATAVQLLSQIAPVFSHATAAAAWGLAWIGERPMRLHSTSVGPANAQTRRVVTQHPGPLAEREIRHREGIRVTSRSRTVCDLLRTLPPHAGLAVLDHTLKRTFLNSSDIEAALAARGDGQGSRRASEVLALGDADNDSPGESWSRWLMHELRIPPPVLQKEFHDRLGLIGYVDFLWPDYGVVGEFDGYGKYVREEFTRGRSTADVVVSEKRREDRLRARPEVRRVVRWGWQDLTAPRLGAALLDAGLRRQR